MKKHLKAGLIILINTFILLGAIELGIRIFEEKPEGKPRELAYEFNEDYLVQLKPNIEKTFIRQDINGGDTILWRTNSQGFRGAELEEGKKRIIVYGDSNIQGRFSTEENSFCGQLETQLEALNGESIEVVNAGLLGAGPDQSLIRFKQQYDLYQPDFVVFHLFADNDFGDLIRNKLFTCDTTGKLIERPIKKEIDSDLLPQKPPKRALRLRELASRIRQSILGYNQEKTLERFLISMNRVCGKEFTWYQNEEPRRHSHFHDHYDFDLAAMPSSEASQEKVRLMTATLQETHRFALEKKCPFLVLIQPSIHDLVDDYKVNSTAFLKDFPDYRASNLSDFAASICKENNIPYLNLFPHFKDNSPNELFFKGWDNHWNEKGQTLSADLTASAIAGKLVSEVVD